MISPFPLLYNPAADMFEVTDVSNWGAFTTNAIVNPSHRSKLVVFDDKGKTCWTTPIKYFDQLSHWHVKYYGEDINVDMSCTLVSCGLLNPLGYLIAVRPFPSPIPVGLYDILKLKIDYDVNGNG
jgi:hypothetical protein